MIFCTIITREKITVDFCHTVVTLLIIAPMHMAAHVMQQCIFMVYIMGMYVSALHVTT